MKSPRVNRRTVMSARSQSESENPATRRLLDLGRSGQVVLPTCCPPRSAAQSHAWPPGRTEYVQRSGSRAIEPGACPAGSIPQQSDVL